MINWDDVLKEILTGEFAGIEMARVGKKIYIRCKTYEQAEKARKVLKEGGITLSVKGEDLLVIAPENLNWNNIIRSFPSSRDKKND